LASSDFKNQTS